MEADQGFDHDSDFDHFDEFADDDDDFDLHDLEDYDGSQARRGGSGCKRCKGRGGFDFFDSDYGKRKCSCCDSDSDSSHDDMGCSLDEVCDFVPAVDECVLDDLIAANPPGGVGSPPGQFPGQAVIDSTSSTQQTVGETQSLEVPDVRTDIYACTNTEGLAKKGSKSNYSGCKKKIFELSGKICVSETQTGGLCEGLEEKSDGAASSITNKLSTTSDGTVVGELPCPPGCCECDPVPLGEDGPPEALESKER